METPVLEFTWNHKRLPNRKNNLEKKFGGYSLPIFKTYNKATVIRIVWYWNKNRYIINRMEFTVWDNPIHWLSVDFWQMWQTIQFRKTFSSRSSIKRVTRNLKEIYIYNSFLSEPYVIHLFYLKPHQIFIQSVRRIRQKKQYVHSQSWLSFYPHIC